MSAQWEISISLQNDFINSMKNASDNNDGTKARTESHIYLPIALATQNSDMAHACTTHSHLCRSHAYILYSINCSNHNRVTSRRAKRSIGIWRAIRDGKPDFFPERSVKEYDMSFLYCSCLDPMRNLDGD